MRASPSSDHTEPLQLSSLSTAPLGGVMLALVALWIMGIRTMDHSLDFDLAFPGCLGYFDADVRRVEVVTIEADGVVAWNGEVLASREALESRMLALRDLGYENQPMIHVMPHQGVSYGAFLAVMAVAQRHGVSDVRVIEGTIEMRVVPAKV
ncbi:biopolymer transporter ExbD [Mitsuaria sp. 7]|uniref:ExbD/TolR family protein n=1 Tax=Mitsuaria sp. 7 TaxID=1658665 RepID=UPI0012FA21A2|nr:biopolymer transporter ExbD [Mitsuaria sp. 7]